MARVSKIGKERKLSNRIWEGADGEDVGGFMFGTTIFGVTAGVITSIWFVSWFLALWALPLLFVVLTGTMYGHNSDHIRGSSLFTRARKNYDNLSDEYAKKQAKILLDNVHRHQLAFQRLNKDHQDRYDCRDCAQRADLINELYENQALPELDRSDIETVESTLAARKEIDKHEVRSAKSFEVRPRRI